jgi:hypothetical protein
MDTASTTNMISDKVTKRLMLRPRPNTSIIINMARGQTKSIGSIEILITIGSMTRKITANVMKDFPYELLLGINIGKVFQLILELQAKKAILRSPQICNTLIAEQDPSQNTGYPEITTTLNDDKECFAKDN